MDALHFCTYEHSNNVCVWKFTNSPLFSENMGLGRILRSNCDFTQPALVISLELDFVAIHTEYVDENLNLWDNACDLVKSEVKLHEKNGCMHFIL